MNREKLLISRRLRMNAALVTACSVFADIGCDHAYTSIYLVKSGIAKKALALDVREGPLCRAKENIHRYGLDASIQTRLSDGLCALCTGEADCILISGMGGPLMIQILRKDWEKVCAADCLILQPQSEIAAVRRFLHSMHWEITAEDMCEEEGKYYTVMRARKGDREAACKYSEEEYAYGACLIKERHPVLKRYLQKELETVKVLLAQLDGQNSERGKNRYAEFVHKKEGLHALLAEFETGD